MASWTSKWPPNGFLDVQMASKRRHGRPNGLQIASWTSTWPPNGLLDVQKASKSSPGRPNGIQIVSWTRLCCPSPLQVPLAQVTCPVCPNPLGPKHLSLSFKSTPVDPNNFFRFAHLTFLKKCPSHLSRLGQFTCVSKSLAVLFPKPFVRLTCPKHLCVHNTYWQTNCLQISICRSNLVYIYICIIHNITYNV